MSYLIFIISAVLIFIAGRRLTVYADKLCERLQLGRIWIGIVLLGIVTSLPEAVSSLVSVISLQANDLAVGNLLGSNNFNPLLLVVMDASYRQGSITDRVVPQRSHAVSAWLAIVLTFLVVVEIFVNFYQPVPVVAQVSVGSLLIAGIYLVGMKSLSTLGQEGGLTSNVARMQAQERSEDPLVRISVNLLLSAVAVTVAAIWLAKSADVIAARTGLGRTFVGTIFLAVATSLPELVVTLSAVKIGSLDLAVGNIFGSNMGNIFILAVCDVFYRSGAILSRVSPVHIVSGLLSISITLTALWGIYKKDKKTLAGWGLDSITMLILFAFGMVALYQLRWQG